MIPDTLTPDQEKRLAALEQALAFSERLRAARVAQDVDVVAFLHQMRATRDAELGAATSAEFRDGEARHTRGEALVQETDAVLIQSPPR